MTPRTNGVRLMPKSGGRTQLEPNGTSDDNRGRPAYRTYQRTDTRSASPDNREPVTRDRSPRAAGFHDTAGSAAVAGAGLDTVNQGKNKNLLTVGQAAQSQSLNSISPLFEPTGEDSVQARSYSSSVTPPTGTSPTDLTKENLDPLQRAREMKAQLIASSSVPAVINKGSARKRVEEDPENILIKDLRVKHGMGWTAIANFLNEERLKCGEPQTMTQPAVYSRFVRNAPRIAAANGEVGFDPKDYMHLRHPHNYPNSSFLPRPNRHSKNNDDDEEQFPREIKGNIRQVSKLTEESQELETTELTTLLLDSVGVVQRNFWVFVADELERTSGKLYDPRVLESRFKQF